MQVSVVLTEEEVKPEVHLHKQEPQALQHLEWNLCKCIAPIVFLLCNFGIPWLVGAPDITTVDNST
jgi:hypothetical protein